MESYEMSEQRREIGGGKVRENKLGLLDRFWVIEGES